VNKKDCDDACRLDDGGEADGLGVRLWARVRVAG
jgi:hypothetical protein